MKQYLRIVVLFVVAVVLLLVFTVFRKASAPESSIIAGEKKKIEASLDKNRTKDPIYAAGVQEKLRLLDYRIAVAYNKENKPDDAITVLQKLIAQEESKSAGARRSASYEKEANYYEALQAAYALKHDDAGAERANDRRRQAAARAEEAKKKERLEDGRSVGINGE